jgi:hypothetical protein
MHNLDALGGNDMTWIILFIIGLLLIMPMRLVELASLQDKNETLEMVFAAITVVVILGFLIPVIFKKIKVRQNPAFWNRLSGILSVLLAVLFLYDGISTLIYQMFHQTLNAAYFFVFIFEIVSALFFMLYLFPYHFKLQKMQKNYVITALFPVLWVASQMLDVFLQSTTGKAVTLHSFTILANAFTLLYFFNQARVLAKIEYDKGQRGMLLFGYLSSLFLIVSVVSNILNTGAVNRPDETKMAGILVSSFMFLYILTTTVIKNFGRQSEPVNIYEYESNLRENTDIDDENDLSKDDDEPTQDDDEE